jgi:hypothetical protein
MIADMTADMAEALRGVLDLLDDGAHGLKSIGPRSNDCGCHCCDEDDTDEVLKVVRGLLGSEKAARARLLLTRYEWSR